MPRRDRIIEKGGYKYLELKSGRLVTFWDMHRAAESAHTELVRALSRAFKIVGDDYDLERLEWFIESERDYLDHMRGEIDNRRGVKTRQERIALLRNVTGRTPAEAEAFRRKADQLEAELQDGGE